MDSTSRIINNSQNRSLSLLLAEGRTALLVVDTGVASIALISSSLLEAWACEERNKVGEFEWAKKVSGVSAAAVAPAISTSKALMFSILSALIVSVTKYSSSVVG